MKRILLSLMLVAGALTFAPTVGVGVASAHTGTVRVWTGSGDDTTGTKKLHKGHHRVRVVANDCDGNVIIWLIRRNGYIWDRELLANIIRWDGTSYAKTTHIYGLRKGSYYIDAITSCSSWKVKVRN